MGFTPRLSAPSATNKYYKHTSAGGLNECILIGGGSCLPNCVGYAWGRFYEIMGKRPTLSKGNAENWYSFNDGYKRGKTPKLGAVICWAKGKVGVSSDGAGHVGIVEKINSDGSIVVSQSGYGGSRFFTSTIKKGYAQSGYTFLGFIYNPAVSDSTTTKSSTSYKIGSTYTLQDNMKVRAGYGKNYRQLKRSELTANAKEHALSGTYAVLKKGTKVTCMGYKNGFMKIPSGYVCAKDGSKVYIK